MVKTAIIVLQIGFLVFLAWEFIGANTLPQKYAKLKPAQIRSVDTTLFIVTVATIYYVIKH